jgi:hypothetical protein
LCGWGGRLYALVVVGEGAAGEAVLVEGVGEAVVPRVVHLERRARKGSR